MRRTHRAPSRRVADRRPRGGRKIGRARNRLSSNRYRDRSRASAPGGRKAGGSEFSHADAKEPEESKRTKTSSAGAHASALPTYIRATGVHFGPDERAYTHRKLGQKLDKFATSIERISIRIDDVNGPRGGGDQLCRIKVVLTGQPSIMVDSQHAKAHAAVDAAIKSVEKAVRRTVRRRRMNPIRAAA